MIFFMSRCLGFILCLLSLSLFAEVRDNTTGEVFPSDVSFTHEGTQFNLQATGVSTRKKFFVTVYSIAHYLQNAADIHGGNKFQEILQDGKAKQFILKWERNVDSGKVQEGFQESFKKALSGSEYKQLQNQIAQFIQFFNHEVKKGDEHILRWIPGGYVEVIINGNKAGSITNQEFAKGLWNIWFGEKSVVDRNQLISLMK